LDALVEEILLASRLDHVERLEHTEPVDLLALATEEGARYDIEVIGTPATVRGDDRLLSRLVRNLIQNALRHGAPPVTVAISRDENSIQLRVHDHGAGIPESENARIFEPFYRPSGRSERSGGWGLGLALVRQIAGHHGATVHYKAAPGGGACFVVTFPAHRGGE
jgi:two-component system OmpR family sensor kinase